MTDPIAAHSQRTQPAITHAVRAQCELCDLPHGIRNQLAIVLGFCELVVGTLAEDDPCRHDMRQIEQAARTALAQLPGDAALFPEGQL